MLPLHVSKMFRFNTFEMFATFLIYKYILKRDFNRKHILLIIATRQFIVTYRSPGVVRFQFLEKVDEDSGVLFVENSISLLKHLVKALFARHQKLVEEICKNARSGTLW